MPGFLRKHLLMEGEPGGGGGGNPPAPPPGPAPAPPAPAPSPAPAAPSPSPAPAPGPAPGPAPAPAPVAATWPEDWRTQMAGGDEKLLKQLERYASPRDVSNAWVALRTKVSSGELKSALPKDAKPEEIAKWREENGVPDKPEGYKMPEGVVIGDADKPHINGFLKTMHAKNASPELVQEGIKYYFAMQEAQIAQLAEGDETHKQEMEDTLRAEWGGQYRANVNAISTMLDGAPGGIKDKILSARMADGRAVANDPEVLRWLATTARELNPVATVVPAGGDQTKAIDDEIASLKSLMGNRESEYWKGPKAAGHQARYRELVAARDRRK
jgi:hypothetical protein